jgi:fibronectin type 3 domain-containing protein
MRPGRRYSSAIVALVMTVTLASAPVALAVFGHTATGGPLTLASATLAAPGSVKAAQVGCRTNKTPEIEVSWSATSSTYATSYTVERATTGSGPYTSVASVPIGETSSTDKSASLGYSTTYYYRVTTVFHSWSTSSTSASVKTLSKYCL